MFCLRECCWFEDRIERSTGFVATAMWSSTILSRGLLQSIRAVDSGDFQLRYVKNHNHKLSSHPHLHAHCVNGLHMPLAQPDLRRDAVLASTLSNIKNKGSVQP